jgi:hypothetical protein
MVDRGGRADGVAALGLRFHTLVIGDAKRVPIQAETVYRFASAGRGTGSVSASSSMTGVGSGVRQNAGPGLMARSPFAGPPTRDIRIPAGSPLTVRLSSPVTIDR